jgi:hypothetical protein
MDKKAFLEQQYLTLRKEIESSRDRHFKIAAGALVIVPAVEIFASAIKVSIFEGEKGESMGHILAIPLLVILLLLPIIVLALHAIWVAEHLAISRCGYYIREYIEPAVPEVVGWEKWLGRTWVEQRAEALTKKDGSDINGISLRVDLKKGLREGSSLHPNVGLDLKEVRAHEGLQELAFRLLYVSIYGIAAVSTVFVCFAVVSQAIRDWTLGWVQVLVQALTVLGLLSFYTYLWLLERQRVLRAIEKEARALEDKREALEDKREASARESI